MKPWYIYLLRCGDGTLYTGISNDVERRLAAHRSGRGARYLRGRAPLVLARKLRVGPVGDALKVERQVKRMSPAGKEKLIAGKIRLKDLIEKDVRRQTSDVRRKTLDVSKKKKFKNKKANTI